VRWAWLVACGGRGDVLTVLWWDNLRERGHFGEVSIDGKGKVVPLQAWTDPEGS